MTPLFGGGAVAGQVDPRMPVRGTSIRGHLRFWWRIVRGCEFTTPAQMRQREAEIFGDTENPSPVVVRVRDVRPAAQPHRMKSDRCGDRNGYFGFDPYGPEAYALFAAKSDAPTSKRRPIDCIGREGLSFTLDVTHPPVAELQRLRDAENELRRRKRKELLPATIADIGPDLDAALRAWLKFGGVGSRTRRGLGALHPEKPEPLPPPPGCVLQLDGEGTDDPMLAWRKALDIYQWFRQKAFRRIGRGRQDSPRGRSSWPEPDSLRRLTGCSTPAHREPVVPADVLPCFPKAALGLPIVFKFADGPDDGRVPNRDPGRVTLNAHTGTDDDGRPTGDRMASPVIVRPVWRVDLRQWVAGFVYLPRPEALTVSAYIAGNRATPNEAPILVPNGQIVGERVARCEPTHGLTNAVEALRRFVRDALGQHPNYYEQPR